MKSRAGECCGGPRQDAADSSPPGYPFPMALDPKLLEILACPQDHGPLLYFEADQWLYNPRLKQRYRIDNGIPVMLIDESEQVDDAEHQRLVAKAEAEGIEPTFA